MGRVGGGEVKPPGCRPGGAGRPGPHLSPLHHLIGRAESLLHQRADVLRLELQLLPDEVHLHGELGGGQRAKDG